MANEAIKHAVCQWQGCLEVIPFPADSEFYPNFCNKHMHEAKDAMIASENCTGEAMFNDLFTLLK